MILDKFSLNGKVAIVTGSDTGLGQGFSKAFVEAGAKVLGGSEYGNSGNARKRKF